MLNFTGNQTNDATGACDDDVQQHVKSVGRRVFRAIPGNVKQFHNRFDYTGGGAKVGAKPCHIDDAFGRRARRLALEQAQLADFQEELSSLSTGRVVEFRPEPEPLRPEPLLEPDRQLQFSNEDCLCTLIYRGGKLVFANAQPIRRCSSDRSQRKLRLSRRQFTALLTK